MTRTVTFAHALDDTVHLKTINQPVRVIGLRLDFTGECYHVLYRLGAQEKKAWVFGCELQPLPVIEETAPISREAWDALVKRGYQR